MSAQAYWRFSVSTSRESEEAVSELLAEVFGMPAVVHQNTQTGSTRVSVFCPRKSDLTAARRTRVLSGLRAIREIGLDLGSGRIRVVHVPAEDWANSWKRHFQPWEAGPRLLVKPSWSQRAPRKGQAVMTLDPGLSFGTGQHPTTRFCLKQLVRLRREGAQQALLDMGSGSGILAIGAALLGYSPVQAFDFDPEAVRVARENLRANGVERRVKMEQADLTKMPLKAERRYEVVCANLMHDLLIAERRRIVSRVAPGGSLILAGILVQQFEAVARAFAGEGWILRRGRTEGEWRSGHFTKAA